MIEARLADGSIMRFPDGTDPAVIQSTVKKIADYKPIPGAQMPPAEPQEPGTGGVERFASSVGAPVDILNRAISPGLEAMGVTPSQAPVGGSASIEQFLTGGEAPLTELGPSAVANFPESATQFAQDVAAPFVSPIETAKNVGNLALGALQKAVPGTQEKEVYADAVGDFFAERYGGWENVKSTMATDPVGFMADVATVLTGGGALAGRAPGVTGQVAREVGKAGALVDPARIAARAAAPVAKGAGKVAGPVASYLIGDLGTHTGRQSLETAAGAGLAGGRKAEAFRESMRGLRPMETVVSEAHDALRQIRQGRGREYRAGMAGVARDKSVLDFAPIDRALSKAVDIKRFKGEPIGKATAVTDEITQAVNEWKMLDPTDFHTPEGMDALKQKVGAIRESTQYGTPERTAANLAYGAIKDQIVSQAPEYGRIMKSYWQATDLIKEMERTLSLNPKAMIDTQLRKLQSLMRNNANTNYGRRLVLGEMLAEAGADTLMEQLAGQSLQPLTPRGLGRVVAGGTMAGGAAVDPTLLGLLPFQSPRVMGEAAYLGGTAARKIPEVMPRSLGLPLFQAGRLEEME